MKYTLELDLTQYAAIVALYRCEIRDCYERRHWSYTPKVARKMLRDKIAMLRKLQSLKPVI